MSDSDVPYLVILLYHTLLVLVIYQSNSKIAGVLCSYVNTHNCVIESENKLLIQILCAWLSFPHK